MGKRKAQTQDVVDGPCPMELDIVSPLSPPIRKKRKQTIPKCLKITVWNDRIGLDIGRALCSVCKTNYITQMDFHCGHIVAEADGGETCASNLIPICHKCNLSMGKRNLNAFKDKYFK